MKFASTRSASSVVGLSEAIRSGAAPDGGLYLPLELPRLAAMGGADLPSFASQMLQPFFAGDPLEGRLDAICREAFNFPLPLVSPDPNKPMLKVLELFHGPTGAFKDFGARFLMLCLDRIGDARGPLTVLAATSGDTGGAVGCAAEGRATIRTIILYPRGRVSAFQELQLTCWDDPVLAVEVDGDFDDCQRLVKAAFADADLSKEHRLTSANSINIGRLLPQISYLAYTAARLHAETGVEPGFIIPTGNLGHGFAAVYARAMGFPLGPILLVTNANCTLSDWHSSGRYKPRPSIATISNAMDVGTPSNFERLVKLPSELREIEVATIGDSAIADRIHDEYRDSGYVWCPHSAAAAEAYARLPEARRQERLWIAAATAHPFKFSEVVEPLIGRMIEAPPGLAAIRGRSSRKALIPADLPALTAILSEKHVTV